MALEQYLQRLVMRYNNSNVITGQAAINDISRELFKFDRKTINKIHLIGSTVKKTNSRDVKVIELFISLNQQDKRDPEEVLDTYKNHLIKIGSHPKRTQFALNFPYMEHEFEILPAKHKFGTYNYHYLFDNWNKKTIVTNTNLLQDDVLKSKLQSEIILLKLWRDKHGINFPSIYIEMVVLHVLGNFHKKNLFSRLIRVLDFLRKDFVNEKFYDMSNTKNIISDCITREEKEKIRLAAKLSMTEEFVKDIID